MVSNTYWISLVLRAREMMRSEAICRVLLSIHTTTATQKGSMLNDKSVQARLFFGKKYSDVSPLACEQPARMDSNHDKVIQSLLCGVSGHDWI